MPSPPLSRDLPMGIAALGTTPSTSAGTLKPTHEHGSTLRLHKEGCLAGPFDERLFKTDQEVVCLWLVSTAWRRSF